MWAQLLMLAALADGQPVATEIDASKIAAPELINAESLMTPSDYPWQALRAEQQGFVLSRLTINKSGKVDQCKILISSKSDKLDETTCRIFERRAKFKPAIGVDGKESFGIFTTLTRWIIQPFEKFITYYDVFIELNRLPNNLSSPKQVYLSAAVDENGKPLACRHVEDSDRAKSRSRNTSPFAAFDTDDPQLISIGCKEIMAGEFLPANTSEGVPVPSVQGLRVEFTTPGSADNPSGTPTSLSTAMPADPNGR